MRARLVENINFKRGQDSKGSLRVGAKAFAYEVIDELKATGEYDDFEFEVSDDGEKILCTAESRGIDVEHPHNGTTEFIDTEVKQHIDLTEKNKVSFWTAINYPRQNSTPINNSRLEAGSEISAEVIAQEALLNLQDSEYEFEDLVRSSKMGDDMDRASYYMGEAVEFKRGQSSKRALDVGNKIEIGLHLNSYMFAKEIFHGTMEEARLEAAKRLVGQWDYSGEGKDYINGLWATFSEWTEKARNIGGIYKDAETGKYKQEEVWEPGWEEDFTQRLRLKNVDITKLRFDDELEELDT